MYDSDYEYDILGVLRLLRFVLLAPGDFNQYAPGDFNQNPAG